MSGKFYVFIFGIMMLASQALKAQDDFVTQPEEDKTKYLCKKTYLGFASGINANSGLIGVAAEFGVAPKISLAAGAGIGIWGVKFSGEGRYYFKECYRGWAIGLGVTTSRGISYMELGQADSSGYINDYIPLTLYPQVNVAVQGYRFWKIGKKNKIYIHTGYSSNMSLKKYRVLDNQQLSRESKATLDLMVPGGLTLGFGLCFGL